MVRKRSGFCIKALNFAIIAAWIRWSGTQNSEVGEVDCMMWEEDKEDD